MVRYCYTIHKVTAIDPGTHRVDFDIFEVLDDKYKPELYVEKKEADKKIEYLVSKKVDNDVNDIGNFSFLLEQEHITPLDELQPCFEIYHQHAKPEDVSPTLRESWIIAHIAEHIAKQLNKTFER